MKDKILKTLDGIRKFLLNPHLMICYGIAWIITNGWAYIGIRYRMAYKYICGISCNTLVSLLFRADSDSYNHYRSYEEALPQR